MQVEVDVVLMTAHRKRPAGPARPRTAAEWVHSEWCLVDDELYVGGPYQPLTLWERYGASLVVLVALACLLVAWLLWGGHG